MTQITYFPDTFKIKDVLKVNNQVFYHIYDGEEYYLYFNYNDEWNRCKVTKDIEVHYINFTYVVFTTDNIFGFKYKYDEKLWVYYESDTLVYIPTSTITQGATTEDYESDNIVTSEFINQYIIESGIYTDTSFLEGKKVVVIFGDKYYYIEWKEEYAYTLVGEIGELKISLDKIVINNNGIYLGYNTEYYLDAEGNRQKHKFENRTSIYYSMDGSVWKEINIPSAIIDAHETDENVDYAVCLSEDGSTIWIVYNAFAEMDGNNVVRIYYTALSIESLNYDVIDWQPIDCTINNEYKTLGMSNNANHGSLNHDYVFTWESSTGSELHELRSAPEPRYYYEQSYDYYINTVKVGETLNNKIKPIIHSAEDGVCTILLGSSIDSVSRQHVLQTLTAPDSTQQTPNGVSEALFIENLEKPIDIDDTISQSIDEWTFTTKLDGKSENVDSSDIDYVDQHAAPLLILIKGYTAFSCISPDDLYCVSDKSTASKVQFLKGIKAAELGGAMPCTKDYGLVYWDNATEQEIPNNYFEIRYYPSNIDGLDIILLYQYTRYGTITYAAYFNGEADFYWSLLYSQDGIITFLRSINQTVTTDPNLTQHVAKLGCVSYDGTFEFDEFYKFQDMKLTSIITGYSAGTGKEVSTTVECAHDSRQIITWNIEESIAIDINKRILNTSAESYDEYKEWCSGVMFRPYTAVYNTSELTTLRVQNTKEEKYTSKFFKLNHDIEAPYVLTEYYYYRKELYSYFPIDDYYCRPIGFVNGYIYYYFTKDGLIYSSNGFGPIYINDYNRREDTDKRYNYLLPAFAETFITTTVGIDNKIYQVNNTNEDDGLLYIPESSKVELTDTITGLIVFSQSLLGVFTAHTAYEYIYGTNDDEDDLTSYLEGYYYLIPTKLQLGNRADNDILPGFDGSTVYMPTILGLATLTYEYFVQTTEHVFNYISDNIYTLYKQWDTSPVKLEQFEHWVFMYRQDTPQIYVYDTRSQAWWMWTLPIKPTKIYYQDKTLYLLLDEQLYYLDFDNQSIYDYDGNPIHWKFTSQKLHFGYPTNYKHLTTLTVVTTQQTDSIKYNLKFKNYHNIYDSTTEDTIEYNIETLANCIKKVNFMKTNAIQFELSSDDDRPTPFVTSDIALKYRITEKIR